MNTMIELFEDLLKDTYNAEQQFVKAMPKLAERATDQELKSTIEAHLRESEKHVWRLERVAEMIGSKPTGKSCKAAKGLVEEAEELIGEVDKGPILDAGIIACAQKNEHYEISAYGTLCAWARELGLDQVVPLLTETLREEKNADMTLTDVAVSAINVGSAKTHAARATSPSDRATLR